jgi:hypothetical protein
MQNIPPSPDQLDKLAEAAFSFFEMFASTLPPPPDELDHRSTQAMFSIEACVHECGGLVVMKYEDDGPRKITHFPTEYDQQDAAIALQGIGIGYAEGVRDTMVLHDGVAPSMTVGMPPVTHEPSADEL